MLTKFQSGIRLVVGLPILLLASSACAEEAAESGEVSSVRAPLSSSLEALPSDELNLYAQRMLGMFATVVDRSIESCMAAAGFDYHMAGPTVVDLDNLSVARYGPTDTTLAARQGYLSSPDAVEEEPVEIAPTSAEYQRQLVGDQADFEERELQIHDGTLGYVLYGGCSGRATIEAYGSADNYFDTLMSFSRFEDFSNQSYVHLQSSPEYRSAAAAWAECMRSGGEPRFEEPLQAQAFNWESPRPSDDEIRVAGLDSECKTETSFVSIVSNVEREWQLANLDAYQGDLERLREAYADVTERYAALD